MLVAEDCRVTDKRVKTFIKKRLLKIHTAVWTLDLYVSKSKSPILY